MQNSTLQPSRQMETIFSPAVRITLRDFGILRPGRKYAGLSAIQVLSSLYFHRMESISSPVVVTKQQNFGMLRRAKKWFGSSVIQMVSGRLPFHRMAIR